MSEIIKAYLTDSNGKIVGFRSTLADMVQEGELVLTEDDPRVVAFLNSGIIKDGEADVPVIKTGLLSFLLG